MSRYIITDLTRFTNKSIVCTAMIDEETGECFRPIPYFEFSLCKTLNLKPGSIIKGTLTRKQNVQKPHVEDSEYFNLEYIEPCTADQFMKVLKFSIEKNIEDGFRIKLNLNQKHIETSNLPNKSIISIEVDPANIEIKEDVYKPGKIKLNFIDGAGKSFNYVSITDLGFHDYVLNHFEENNLANINSFIRSQKKVILRVGLSRSFKAPDGREGYWLQVNGLYTFPDYIKKIRNYE